MTHSSPYGYYVKPVSKCERLILKRDNLIPYSNTYTYITLTHIASGECIYKPNHRSSTEKKGQYFCILM